jgi:4-alpha-glucanotransferase
MTPQLNQIAHLYNVQTSYYGVRHRRRQASVESVLGVLQALGAPVASGNDILSAVRERTLELKRRLVEPVTVAWNGERPKVRICIPVKLDNAAMTCRLETETGELSTWQIKTDELPVLQSEEVEGTRYITGIITLPKGLPYGYHQLTLELKGSSCQTLIISAPQKTYSPSGEEEKRRWGVFIPLYALQGRNSWGSGDYSTLRVLTDRVAEKGGGVIATLPLLPLFLDKPFEPSPYAPVSRLLWSEFYVDINTVPELKDCEKAQALVTSESFRQEIERLRQDPMVDYCPIMSLKRQAMEEMYRCLLNSASARCEEFRHFIRENPLIEKYAVFRAVMEKRHTSWTSWPQSLRDGTITADDYNEAVKNYHLYAQWLAYQQVQTLSTNARVKGIKMYFDLPLGVHTHGFDVWQHRRIFATTATAGAPPDSVFTGGQNWYFPPLHPERIRQGSYRYIRDYLRHHLQYADILRIDHVMGLHRLFWIPSGQDASQGVYVRYRADELYAILAVESHCHHSVIVGEDLGIVPFYVRKAMAHHGLHRMCVLHYELTDDPSQALRRITSRSVASLNTHDMPPFAAFWQENDIEERLSLGLVDEKGAIRERKARRRVKNTLIAYLRQKKLLGKVAVGTREVLKACLAYLSASRARLVLVNLEDLWLETRSQNVPGTGEKFPSWQRKSRCGLDDFNQMKEVGATLEEVDRHRKRKAGLA